MEWMSRSNMILMAVAVYIAVMTLVRLMRRRRDELVADVQRQFVARRHHRKRRHVDTDHEHSGAA